MHHPGKLEELKKDILFEDNHLIAINKHPGDIVQGDKTGDTALLDILKDYIKKEYNKPGDVYLGLVHRIDRPVSGVVLFARTSKALSRMNALVKAREITKTYWAICEDTPDPVSGELEHYLAKNASKNKSYVCKPDDPKGKKAILSYRLVGKGDRYSFLEVDLLSGRHHQIRVQLSHIACIIKGDLKYGAARSNPDGSISLHARAMSFIHPVRKEKITITAPVPDEPIWKAFEQIESEK